MTKYFVTNGTEKKEVEYRGGSSSHIDDAMFLPVGTELNTAENYPDAIYFENAERNGEHVKAGAVDTTGAWTLEVTEETVL